MQEISLRYVTKILGVTNYHIATYNNLINAANEDWRKHYNPILVSRTEESSTTTNETVTCCKCRSVTSPSKKILSIKPFMPKMLMVPTALKFDFVAYQSLKGPSVSYLRKKVALLLKIYNNATVEKKVKLDEKNKVFYYRHSFTKISCYV